MLELLAAIVHATVVATPTGGRRGVLTHGGSVAPQGGVVNMRMIDTAYKFAHRVSSTTPTELALLTAILKAVGIATPIRGRRDMLTHRRGNDRWLPRFGENLWNRFAPPVATATRFLWTATAFVKLFRALT